MSRAPAARTRRRRTTRSDRWTTPWWALVSSASAPILLIGGWTLAAGRQGGGFDPVVESISALAAVDADQRWIMTSALFGVGACHLATAAGLRAAAGPGRILLATGGAATLLVAALPLPVDGGSATAHAVFAGLAFGALGLWPALSWRRHAPVAALRAPVALGAAAVLLGLLGWFVGELGGGSRLGLAERVAAGAQACWPFWVALTGAVARSGARSPN